MVFAPRLQLFDLLLSPEHTCVKVRATLE